MAHFRGTVEGMRGCESRLGSKESGLRVVAQSWDGQVEVSLYEHNGVDYACITVGPNRGKYGGDQASKCIASAPIKELRGIK